MTTREESAWFGNTDRPEPLPEHLKGPFPETSLLGGTTGRMVVRCEICLASAPVEEWRTITHKPDCKHPVESYVDDDDQLVVQATGSPGEWISTPTPMEARDLEQPTAVDWTATADELEESR